MEYNTWNEILAKKFAIMFKNFRKFSMKFLNKDPLAQVEQEEDKEAQAEEEIV